MPFAIFRQGWAVFWTDEQVTVKHEFTGKILRSRVRREGETEIQIQLWAQAVISKEKACRST